MSELPSLQVIITAHKEGNLLLPTLQSAFKSLDALAEVYKVNSSIMIYLDNPDTETSAIAEELSQKFNLDLYYGSNGDPGQSRNEAIKLAKNELIALLDGDDLWSENWLEKVYEDVFELIKNKKDYKNKIYHPEYNLIFGGHNLLVRQGNPKDSFFNTNFLRASNYWDALCVAHKSIFDTIPYKKNNVAKGYAHEDFHWSCVTWLANYEHVLIADTLHFKRRRGGSVSAVANEKNVKCYTTELQYYRENYKEYQRN